MTGILLEEKATQPESFLQAEEILQDYRLVYRSRQVSLIGRREVLSGKAKFGIFGDGKELVQLAISKVFKKGDFRSGYYRDQTLMFALGELTVQELYAQLYAHTDVQADPATAGRAMNGHYATRSLNPDGSWKSLQKIHNSAADVSPTGAQMPRLVGLAYASRLYREIEDLRQFTQFSQGGNEVTFGNIGNASTSEGMFWEALNAIGVLQSPAIITVYDDGYGISVTNEYQMIKRNIYELLKGFQRTPGKRDGYDLYKARGWDFLDLLKVYTAAEGTARKEHVPAIIHVTELTQPQGHSTSGSHERYKSKERLAWEEEHDCLKQFREWIILNEFATHDVLAKVEDEERKAVEEARKKAWQAYSSPIQKEIHQVIQALDALAKKSAKSTDLTPIRDRLRNNPNPVRRDMMAAIQESLSLLRNESLPEKLALISMRQKLDADSADRFHSHLYSQSQQSALKIQEIAPRYALDAPQVYGFEVLNACFDAALARNPLVMAFGEDVGKLGDVNQGFRGLQEKYGALRVSDTGIRETTIIGQAIGMAMRGLRPIAEIQYLDYILYGLQIMSDDLATLRWRTKAGQIAPVIVRTRGHRLEGIWHSGSLMAGIINLVRGMYVLVPRNMTQPSWWRS